MSRPFQRRQQQDRLLNEAISHGPYLWSNRDVENALLWFQSSSSTISENAYEPIEGNDNSEGCEFLRRLLHARGIEVPRPLPDRHQRSSRTTRKSLSGDKSSTDRSNTNKYRKHLNGGGGKRKRKDVGCTFDKVQPSPLQSIITGYYQLFLTLPGKNSQTSGGSNDTADGHFTSSDIQNAEIASSKLLSDMSVIISARRHTDNIYQAFVNSIYRGFGGNLERVFRRTLPGTALEISQSIDEYMIHPTTCTRRVYASSLFDRMLDLCPQVNSSERFDMFDNTSADDNADSAGIDNINDSALHKFLQKIFGLAATNAKIQEVVLLLLLEPVRRLHVRRIQAKESECVRDEHSQNTLHQKQQPTADMELRPLIASTSFWCDISAETIERVCSHPPIPSLVQFILLSSPKTKKLAANVDDNPDTIRHFAQSITWWTLPFPLLCTVSQLHFPIARRYIHYWIERAVASHEKLYVGTPPKPHQSASCTNKSEFEQAIQRIKEFCSASDRLHFLCSHALQSIEKESQKETEMTLISEKEENTAFMKSLAWEAIHRLLL